MKKNFIKGKFFISGSLMLLLMFIHLIGILECCEQQVKTDPIAISAFNG